MKKLFLFALFALFALCAPPLYSAPPVSVGAPVLLTGNQTIAGTKNFTGTVQLGGVSISLPAGTIVGTSDAQTLTNKTIAGASNTLTVREADLSVTDVTTANVTTSAHGFTPKLPNDATKFLDGTGAFSTPGGTPAIIAFQTTSDSTTCLSNATPTDSQMVTTTIPIGLHTVHVHITVEGDASNTGFFWRLNFNGSGAGSAFERAVYLDTNLGYLGEIDSFFTGTTEATLATQIHVLDAFGSINVTTAGTISVQICQATSGGVATPIYAGSFIEIH